MDYEDFTTNSVGLGEEFWEARSKEKDVKSKRYLLAAQLVESQRVHISTLNKCGILASELSFKCNRNYFDILPLAVVQFYERAEELIDSPVDVIIDELKLSVEASLVNEASWDASQFEKESTHLEEMLKKLREEEYGVVSEDE